jgi:diguanylate cyclase (GGDEF)-like protein
MDASSVLDMLRPLVLVVDARGGIVGAHGGLGGFLGHDVPGLVGTPVLDLVAPCDRAEVASFFTDGPGAAPRTTLLPLPYRVRALAPDGSVHAVDVIPTGRPHDPDSPGWVVLLVPIALHGGPSRLLEALLDREPRSTVKRMIAEELCFEHHEWESRLLVVDLPEGRVTPDGSDEYGLADVVERSLAAGWQPWRQVGRGVGTYDVPLLDAPAPIRDAAAAGWSCVEAVPVHAQGDLAAVLVLMTRGITCSPFECTRTNVETRLRGLADVCRLLYARWRDEDRRLAEASTDPLTGLSDLATLEAALAAERGAIGVVRIDVDHFAAVNEQYGRAVGDRVLVEVGRRISSACRRDDVVARVGGDEFVVLLRNVDEVIARRICRRILDEVRLPLTFVGGPRHVSVSLGLAMAGHADDLMADADRAMAVAKRDGRARLVLAS